MLNRIRSQPLVSFLWDTVETYNRMGASRLPAFLARLNNRPDG